MEHQSQMTPLEKCLITAKLAGVPQDQASKFITYGYIPLPWQWKFHATAREADSPEGPVDIGVGGARGPGKSHAVLAQASFDDCQRVPGLKGLFLRQTGVAAKESFDDLIEKVLKGHLEYKRTISSLKFPNGSRIVLGGFKTENDIDKYIGIEYDFIIVEELNQLTANKYLKLRGSLRTSKPNWRPRMYTSFNPGGIGHGHVKERYVIPFRENREKETRFIGSTYLSNPYLNKEYIQFLESLTGDLGKAWREGEWDIFAGQFFKEFRYEMHVCKYYFPFKSNVLVGGLDWGRTDPFATLFTEIKTVDYNGKKFFRATTFAEVYGPDKMPKEWGEIIKDKLKEFNLDLNDVSWIRCDNQIFNTGLDKSKSIADQFIDEDERYRTLLKPASKERIGGWENLHNWLSIAPDGLPYWQITENCTNLIRTLPSLIHDENRVEDIDETGEDHAPDAVRYNFKHLKWIDAKVGGVVHTSAPTTISKTAEFIGNKQVSIDLRGFESPNAISNDSGIGGIVHS